MNGGLSDSYSVSIDPGSTGAVALWKGVELQSVTPILIQPGTGIVNVDCLSWLPPIDRVVIEQIVLNPSMRSWDISKMGMLFANYVTIVFYFTQVLKNTIVTIPPREWYRHFGLSNVKSRSERKAAVRAIVKDRLGIVKNTDECEAIAIGLYAFSLYKT
jgi:hypothetical protein